MRALILILPLGLAGCGGLTYAMSNYGSTEKTEFYFEDSGVADTYRIFDRPEAAKLMITPSLRAAAALGVGRGLTFGASAGTDIPIPVYRKATIAYLASTGRSCEITSFDRVAEPQYEAVYKCRGAAPGATVVARPR